MFNWLFKTKTMYVNGVEWNPMLKSYDEIHNFHNSLDGNHTIRTTPKKGLMMNDGSTITGEYFVVFISGHYGLSLGEYYYKELPEYAKKGEYLDVPNPIRVRAYRGKNRKKFIN